MAEVQVYGRPDEVLVSKGRTAYASSKYAENTSPANANDGDLGNLFHTLNDNGPWWGVDIGKVREGLAGDDSCQLGGVHSTLWPSNHCRPSSHESSSPTGWTVAKVGL